MKHRRQMGRVGVMNSDGHAIGVDIGATAVRAAVLTPGVVDGHPVATMHGCGSVALPPGSTRRSRVFSLVISAHGSSPSMA